MQQLPHESKTDSEYRDLTEPVEILSSVFLLLLANVLKPIKAQLNLNTVKKRKFAASQKNWFTGTKVQIYLRQLKVIRSRAASALVMTQTGLSPSP